MRRVVRVRFVLSGRTYSYRCPGARKGDVVRIDADGLYPLDTRVVGYGRRGYLGKLKPAVLVERNAQRGRR